jgi:predicted transcriptional regulator
MSKNREAIVTARAIIGVADWRKTKSDLRRIAKAIDGGRRLPRADFELNFSDGAELVSEISRERLRLLGSLRLAGALSVYALAKRVGRNYSNVHADVKRLIGLGLIERDKTKRVFVPWSEIRITLPLEQAA